MKKQTSPPNRRGRLVLLCFVLGLILIVMLVGTVYLQHLLGRIHYVDSGTAPTLSPEELDAYLATQPEEINTAPTMDPEDVTFPDYDADIGRDSDIINILLIGQDRREDETRARSDSMILCTFHKSEKKLTMTSFLRDTYVKIPGYGQNRINVAYAAGGMPLLNKTLENNFGVHIDGNVEVDFYQFADIVDLLGGVEVDLRNDEAQWVPGDRQRPFRGNKSPERSAGTGLRPHPQTGCRRGFQPDEPPAQSHHRAAGCLPGHQSFLRPVPSGAGSPPDHHGHDRQGDPRLRRQPLSSDDRRRGRQSAHPRRRNLCQPQY